MPIAYEGSKPYIFVSYSHRNSATVKKIIDHLQCAGYRVWFDGGIEAGSEWPEYIADHLNRCECVLTFISKTFLDSQNCRRELNFALDLKKPVLNVYIEEVELTAGMRMQLGLSQAIFRSNFADEARFLDTLASAKILENCRDSESAKDIPAPPPKKVQPEQKAAKEKAPKEAPQTESRDADIPKNIYTANILLELSYCIVGPLAMKWILLTFPSGMIRFLLMCIPHMLIALLCRMISRHKVPTNKNSDLFATNFFAWAGSTILAMVIGGFLVPLDINGLLRFLMALGLNVMPSIIALVIHFTLIFADTSDKKSK